MELRQLSYFAPTAKVHIAHPALSNQVLAAEEKLDVQLFNRTSERYFAETFDEYDLTDNIA